MNNINESFLSDLREKMHNNITRGRIKLSNGLRKASDNLTGAAFNDKVQKAASVTHALHNIGQIANGNVGPEDTIRLPSAQHTLLGASSILHNAANKVKPSTTAYWKMKLSKL